MDEKIELLASRDIWEKAIERSVNKSIDRELLSLVTNPKGRLAIIEAIANGRYVIEPPKVVQIPKSNGKMREVYVNNSMDRLVLGIINEIYYRLYKDRIHPNCVSYRQGVGVPKIIKSLTARLGHNGESGYKADLSKYFDSVNKATLFELLDSLDTNSPVDKVLRAYYEDDTVIIDGELVPRYKSIAQGCAVGTFLANLALADVDEELSKTNILYYRYSDDIIMLGDDADIAMEKLGKMLEPKGLSLNPKKVSKIDASNSFEFLGAKITGREVDISDDSVQRYKDKIREFTNMKKGMKKKSRDVQRGAIRKINRYLYTDYVINPENFGWGQYFFALCTKMDTLRMLDEFTKDRLKYMYTGKHNHTTNRHKTSNDDLRALGYVSMIHMYKQFKISKPVYETAVRQLI